MTSSPRQKILTQRADAKVQKGNAANRKTAIEPVHHGEVLKEEFLAPLALNARALAHHIGVPPNRVSAIVAGRRGITGDTALRLAAAFRTALAFRLNLQKRSELETARHAAPGLSIPPVAA
jgi:addiction module HigA family antidote